MDYKFNLNNLVKILNSAHMFRQTYAYFYASKCWSNYDCFLIVPLSISETEIKRGNEVNI